MTVRAHEIAASTAHLDETDEAVLAEWGERVRGKNINETTLLATDYLNHFNEIVMLIELLPDMPDMFEEVEAWQPKSYAAHFEDSCFTEKELAVLAYEASPTRFRGPFDTAVRHMDDLVADALGALGEAVAAEDLERIKAISDRVTDRLRRFVDVCSGIIHGDERTMDQGEIDTILTAA